MLKNPFDISFEALPDSLPIFPLQGTLLLPGGQVPLTMFEPRYINLAQDALAAKDRLIGLVLQKDDRRSTTKKDNYWHIGCAGRITSFEETVDGRLLVTLTGYCRFELGDEVNTIRGYRRFAVDWSPFQHDLTIDLAPQVDKDRLITLLKEYAVLAGIEMDWSVLSRMPNFNIITFFSMSLPFSDSERQELISAATIDDRAESLMAMIGEQITQLKRKGSK